MAASRFDALRAHLAAPVESDAGISSLYMASIAAGGAKEDVVVVSALRTPICKAKRGDLKDTAPDALLIAVLKATMDRTKVDPTKIGDIVVGNVLQPGAGAAAARIAQLVCGIPYTVPLAVVNRQCSSGLQAVMNVAQAIAAGTIDCGIGCGVESMSTNSMGKDVPDLTWDLVGTCKEAQDCMIPMGITSENVATRYHVDRAAQDEFAASSHAKAAAAQAAGRFDAEIVPVTTTIKTADGNILEKTVTKDDGVRVGTTAEKLSKLPGAFKPDGTTTAGNSSQVSDGAAAVMLMKRSLAESLKLKPLGIVKAYAVVGVEPDVMGIGPAVAIPKAVEMAGLRLSDIDVFEINEAFASQAVYCVKALGIPEAKVNPNGGAIAFGHPLGCTGARQVATLLHEIQKRKARYGVVSMCIGTGMGAAAVFEAVL